MFLKCGCASPAVKTILKHCAPCGVDLDQRSAGARLRGAGKCAELRRGHEKAFDEGGQLRGLVVVHHVAAVRQLHFGQILECSATFGQILLAGFEPAPHPFAVSPYPQHRRFNPPPDPRLCG